MNSIEYIHEIARVITVFVDRDKLYDPNCEEIAKEILGRDLYIGSLITDIRKHLSKVQKIVRLEKKWPTCLVSEAYYVFHKERGGSYRDIPPMNFDEARKYCLPMGQGIRPYGFRVAKSQDDLIYQASVNHHLKISGSSLGSAYGKLASGAKDGTITVKSAANAIHKSHRRIITDDVRQLEEQADQDEQAND